MSLNNKEDDDAKLAIPLRGKDARQRSVSEGIKLFIQRFLSVAFPLRPLTDTQKIFYNSKVNGAKYTEPPVMKWGRK